MNNFKKIGLTALAGSLAAVSANAVELSVSGETTVSYISNTAAKVGTIGGSSIGTSTGITFSGSGELENGWTVSSSNILNDGDANALSSSQLNLTMGSMGTVTFAKAAGTNVNAIDDVTPKVAEEAWDQGHSVLQGIGGSTNSGAVAYKSPSFDLMGVSASFGVDYDPAAGAAGSDHDAVATKDTNKGSGTGAVIKLAHDSGLTIGAGVESIDSNSGADAEAENVTAYALYTMGPVSVGYQGYFLNNGASPKAGAATGIADYSGDAIGIAFNVNDQVSIGYQKVSETQEALTSTKASDRDIKSLSAAYSSGGMTMSIQQTDTDNYSMLTAGNELDTETVQVTLSFAF